MNVLITGGTGFLGRHLITQFQEKGHVISVLSRTPLKKKSVKSFYWNPAVQEMDENALKETESIIHLAGASLADGGWTEKRKKEIMDSRVKSGELLFEKLKQNRQHIKTFISASAIGIYGNTGDIWVDESSPPSNDFIGEVCKEWEAIAGKIASLGIRVVVLRIGIVLGKDGGALPVFAKPVRFFVGAALGSGNQYMSWIHINDLCRIFMKASEDDSMHGIINAVAPNPRTNKEFTKTLAQALRKPLFMPHVRSFALKLFMGEKASIALDSQRVSSKKLRLTGFQFQFRDLYEALKNIYK